MAESGRGLIGRHRRLPLLAGADRRLLLVQCGMVVCWLLIPLWWRLPADPAPLAPLYSTRFVLFLAMLLTVVAWLLTGLSGLAALRHDPLRAAWALALLTLGMWMYASTGWAFVADRRPDVALNFALQFCLVALWALAAACAGPPPRVVVLALLIGLAWNSALAGAQVAMQGPVGLWRFGEFNINPARSGISVVGAERWLRPYGLLPHPNNLAGLLSVGLLAAVYGLTAPGWRLRALTLAVCAGGVWALLLTFSRGGWLGFAAGAFALLPLLLRLRRVNRGLLAGVALAGGLAALFLLLYGGLVFSRVDIAASGTEPFSVAERAALTLAGYESILAQPVIGVGAGGQPWWSAQYLFDNGWQVRGNYAHQVWVAAWGDLGLVGLLLLLLAMLTGVEAALRAIRAGAVDAPARAALLAGFLALLVSGLFDYYIWALLHFQALWWGLLATALGGHLSPQPTVTAPDTESSARALPPSAPC